MFSTTHVVTIYLPARIREKYLRVGKWYRIRRTGRKEEIIGRSDAVKLATAALRNRK
jgi:hypothetical protein